MNIGITKWFLRYFDKRRRDFDLLVLWPSLCDQAEDIDHAKAGFMLYAMNDKAWTRHYSEDEIADRVDALNPPPQT